MGRCQLSQWNLLTRHWNVCVQFVSHYNLLYLATVSPLHLSLVSAQLTCGSVTRRARHPGHVTNTGPPWAAGLTQTWPVLLYVRTGYLRRWTRPASVRPGLGSGVGTIKSGCWLHSLTPMSKSGIVTCPVPGPAGVCLANLKPVWASGSNFGSPRVSSGHKWGQANAGLGPGSTR